MPPLPRGRRCSLRSESSPQPAPAVSQRPVLRPRSGIPSAGLRVTRHQRGFKQFTRPVFPSPVAARMERAALGLSPELRTPPTRSRRRTSRWGQAIEHGPGTTRSTSHQSILQSCSSITTCDLASHDDSRSRRRRAVTRLLTRCIAKVWASLLVSARRRPRRARAVPLLGRSLTSRKAVGVRMRILDPRCQVSHALTVDGILEAMSKERWLKVDPAPLLASSGNVAISFFARRDLLGLETDPVSTLWRLPDAQRIVRGQQPDGSWRYPGGKAHVRSQENYDQLETFRQAGTPRGEVRLHTQAPGNRAGGRLPLLLPDCGGGLPRHLWQPVRDDLRRRHHGGADKGRVRSGPAHCERLPVAVGNASERWWLGDPAANGGRPLLGVHGPPALPRADRARQVQAVLPSGDRHGAEGLRRPSDAAKVRPGPQQRESSLRQGSTGRTPTATEATPATGSGCRSRSGSRTSCRPSTPSRFWDSVSRRPRSAPL